MKAAAAAIVVLSCVAIGSRAALAQTCAPESVALIGEPEPASEAGLTLPLTVNPDNNSASREIALRASCEITGLIVISDFVSETTTSPLRAETVVSKMGTNDAWERVRHVTVPANQDFVLKLDTTNLWEAGKSRATLSFGGRRLADVVAYNYRLPFPITLATPTPLTITKSEEVSLLLTNGGPHSYAIHWTFGPPGKERVARKADAPASEVVLSPNADAELKFMPPAAWFDSALERYFRPEERTALLTLSVLPPAGETRPDLPRKTISVPIKLESHSPRAKAFASNAATLGLLVLGGLCSLLVNNWVPNRLRRVALQQRIHEIAVKTRGISDSLASQVRVRLRVQRNQDSERLDKVWTWSPNFETVAAEVTRGLDDVSTRVELAAQIDQLISRLYANPHVPVSVVDRSVEEFAQSLDELSKQGCAVTTLEDIRKQIAAVALRVRSARDAQPELAQDLFTRREKLKSRLTGTVTASSLFKAQKPPLPQLIAELNAPTYAKPDDIPPLDYCQLDLALARLQALLDAYAIHAARDAAQQQHMTGKNAKNGTSSFMEILEGDYVANNTAENVRCAKSLVEQMRAGVYAEDIVNELKSTTSTAPPPQIVIDPPLPFTNEAITFSLHFAQATWANSAALRKLRCEWDFGDELKERGWVVSHYFPEAKEYTVTVTIFDLAGAPIAIRKPQGRIERKLVVQKRKSEAWVSGRTRTEIVYMFVALGAAIAALLAGAKESLLQLDFVTGLVAVFLVGFGADSIKNVLTKGRTQ